MGTTELIDLVRNHIQFWFPGVWWHPLEGQQHVTFYFEGDNERYLDFTFLKDGIYRIVEDGIDMGTWAHEHVPNYLDILFFGELHEDSSVS